ncbi:MAG: hypothetical protein K9M75_09945 [Phycisphaerae bacterium]|nr:hypothetical protein [Phycisphaerae bacterium]
MLGIFTIVCLTSYILVNIISDHLMNRGSDKTGKLGPEPRRYETCRSARPLILASQIILLVGWLGCYWPFFFIKGLEPVEFAGVLLLGIAPVAAFAFAICLTLTDKSGFISISDEKIKFHRRRKQLSINACDLIKISYPGLGTFRIHFKDKNTKDIQLCINNFNCQKEIISLMKQFREHVAIANNRQNCFAHKFSPWGFEMFF